MSFYIQFVRHCRSHEHKHSSVNSSLMGFIEAHRASACNVLPSRMYSTYCTASLGCVYRMLPLMLSHMMALSQIRQLTRMPK